MKRLSIGGFTIVESLVVLGVTGALFVSMVVLVAGQQSKARFQSSIKDLTAQIQQQINEVSSGYYPGSSDFTCTANGATVDVSDVSSVNQGSNTQCTFLGRAMMFGVVPVTDPERYLVHTIVGLRETSAGRAPTSLQAAGARALAPGTGTVTEVSGTFPNRSTSQGLQYGLSLAWMRRGSTGGDEIAGFAIVSDPSNQVTYGGSGVLESGSVIPTIIPIPKPTPDANPGVSSSEGADLIARSLGISGGAQIPASAADGPIFLCFQSGTTEQSGLITVGANNSTTSLEFLIFNTLDCT